MINKGFVLNPLLFVNVTGASSTSSSFSAALLDVVDAVLPTIDFNSAFFDFTWYVFSENQDEKHIKYYTISRYCYSNLPNILVRMIVTFSTYRFCVPLKLDAVKHFLF